MLSALWLIPLIGAVFIYRILNLNWFRNEDGSSHGGSVSMGLLEMDAIFNPGSRHIMEERQRAKMEVRKEGELYDRPEDDIGLSDRAENGNQVSTKLSNTKRAQHHT